MKLKFDSSQQYQLTAISSLVDLFEGQPLNQGDFSVTESRSYLGSVVQEELGVGNNLIINDDSIYNNLIKIQEHNDLDPLNRQEFDENGMNFSVEMETGTGKTYVYLNTIIPSLNILFMTAVRQTVCVILPQATRYR